MVRGRKISSVEDVNDIYPKALVSDDGEFGIIDSEEDLPEQELSEGEFILEPLVDLEEDATFTVSTARTAYVVVIGDDGGGEFAM